VSLAKQAEKEYVKKMKVIARGVKRGTKISYNWMDQARSAAWKVQDIYCSEIMNLDLTYSEECDEKAKIRRAVEGVDEVLFMHYPSRMYDFSDKKLLKVLEM